MLLDINPPPNSHEVLWLLFNNPQKKDVGLSWVNLSSKDFYFLSIPRIFQQNEVICIYIYVSTLLALKNIFCMIKMTLMLR